MALDINLTIPNWHEALVIKSNKYDVFPFRFSNKAFNDLN